MLTVTYQKAHLMKKSHVSVYLNGHLVSAGKPKHTAAYNCITHAFQARTSWLRHPRCIANA